MPRERAGEIGQHVVVDSGIDNRQLDLGAVARVTGTVLPGKKTRQSMRILVGWFEPHSEVREHPG